MSILLLGRNGQVGWELQRSLSTLGKVIALSSKANDNPDGLCGDLSDLEGLAQTVRRVAPTVIVNAAAYTAVDKAQTQSQLAHTINAEAPAVLAQEAKQLGAWLVHYSTDYVFNGSGSKPWLEEDATGPLNTYGLTKREGEKTVAAWPKHLIFRTSWVYSARGANFAKTMLRLAGEREQFQVIDDQWGAPTSAELLADITATALRTCMAQPELAGLYHCTASGETNWNAYARFVIAHAASLGAVLKASPKNIDAIASAHYPTAAVRPLNSRLNCDRLQSTFSLHLPPWQQGVSRMLQEILGESQQ
ncbi:MAG: dTDP-4-dehydrorhamnose reductase [Sulfuritalea sp.]|nr:dTDP-4-dehydrorhamnose reductase [Sulfuritalea sp.]